MIGAKMPPEETPTLISELVHRIRSTDSYQEAIETSMRLVELGPACIPELLKELSGFQNKEWKKSLEERDWLLLQILGDIGSASVIPTLEESLKHMIPTGNQPEQVVYWQIVWTLVQCGSFSHFQHALDVFCYDEHLMSGVGHYVLVSLGEKILPQLIEGCASKTEAKHSQRRGKLLRELPHSYQEHTKWKNQPSPTMSPSSLTCLNDLYKNAALKWIGIQTATSIRTRH
jgi:hypothetical protein